MSEVDLDGSVPKQRSESVRRQSSGNLTRSKERDRKEHKERDREEKRTRSRDRDDKDGTSESRGSEKEKVSEKGRGQDGEQRDKYKETQRHRHKREDGRDREKEERHKEKERDGGSQKQEEKEEKVRRRKSCDEEKLRQCAVEANGKMQRSRKSSTRWSSPEKPNCSKSEDSRLDIKDEDGSSSDDLKHKGVKKDKDLEKEKEGSEKKKRISKSASVQEKDKRALRKSSLTSGEKSQHPPLRRRNTVTGATALIGKKKSGEGNGEGSKGDGRKIRRKEKPKDEEDNLSMSDKDSEKPKERRRSTRTKKREEMEGDPSEKEKRKSRLKRSEKHRATDKELSDLSETEGEKEKIKENGVSDKVEEDESQDESVSNSTGGVKLRNRSRCNTVSSIDEELSVSMEATLDAVRDDEGDTIFEDDGENTTKSVVKQKLLNGSVSTSSSNCIVLKKREVKISVKEEGTKETFDLVTEQYHSMLKVYILDCVEYLMKAVTRWAVAVSVPVSDNRNIRVGDITRYVEGIFQILFSFKEGKHVVRTPSGRDLSKWKVDSQQNPIHVSVNQLLKKLLKIKKKIGGLDNPVQLKRYYQIFYASRELLETGDLTKDILNICLPLKTLLPLVELERYLVESHFTDPSLTPPMPPTPASKDALIVVPGIEESIDQETPYMQEQVRCRIGSQGWNDRYVIVYKKQLLVYKKSPDRNKAKGEKDRRPLKILDLRNIKSISQTFRKNPSKSKPSPFCILIVTLDEEELELEFNSKQAMAEWTLPLDGLCKHHFGSRLITPTKSELLQFMYKEQLKGGFVKSSYEEEWSYHPGGTLERHEPFKGQILSYLWDGETLRPKDNHISLGLGKWNGVWLCWYKTCDSTEEPLFRYFWVPSDKEFQTTNYLLTWKWTRHFLASKHGTGEWIMEGEVPSPVIMCLQLMHYTMLLLSLEEKEEMKEEASRKSQIL